jgi:HEAT repeat protein
VQAILALADGGARESVTLLLSLARTARPRVQQMSLLALGELASHDDPDAIEVALQAVNSALPALRYQGLVLLRNLSYHYGLAVMVEHLSDEDPEVRWVAVRLIDELVPAALPQPSDLTGISVGALDVADELRARLDDPVPRVATAATLALARMGEPRAVQRLAGMLEDKNYTLDPPDQQAVIELIGRLRLQSAQCALERMAWPLWREGANTWAARVALAQMGNERARQSILRDLQSISPLKCGRAIVAAGELQLLAARARLEQLQREPLGYDVDAIARALHNLDQT